MSGAKPFFFDFFARPGRLQRAIGRALPARCALHGLLALLLGLACASPRDSFYTTAESNQRVALAFLLKDQECGTAHALTVPVLAPALADDVDACVLGVLDTECEDWLENDPTPDSCRSLQLSLFD